MVCDVCWGESVVCVEVLSVSDLWVGVVWWLVVEVDGGEGFIMCGSVG